MEKKRENRQKTSENHLFQGLPRPETHVFGLLQPPRAAGRWLRRGSAPRRAWTKAPRRRGSLRKRPKTTVLPLFFTIFSWFSPFFFAVFDGFQGLVVRVESLSPG